MNTEVYYEVQGKGKTLGLLVLNGGFDIFGKDEYHLDEYQPKADIIPFRLPNEESINRFLQGSPDSFESTMESPNWGPYTKEDFSFVKVEVKKTPVVIASG